MHYTVNLNHPSDGFSTITRETKEDLARAIFAEVSSYGRTKPFRFDVNEHISMTRELSDAEENYVADFVVGLQSQEEIRRMAIENFEKEVTKKAESLGLSLTSFSFVKKKS
jgi:hypothetical protein